MRRWARRASVAAEGSKERGRGWRRARDEDAAALGVRVEDKGDGGSTWKREDPAVLARERREAARKAATARATKLEKQLQARQAVGVSTSPSSFCMPCDCFGLHAQNIYKP